MLKCLNMDKIKNGIVILSALLIKCQKYVGMKWQEVCEVKHKCPYF